MIGLSHRPRLLLPRPLHEVLHEVGEPSSSLRAMSSLVRLSLRSIRMTFSLPPRGRRSIGRVELRLLVSLVLATEQETSCFGCFGNVDVLEVGILVGEGVLERFVGVGVG